MGRVPVSHVFSSGYMFSHVPNNNNIQSPCDRRDYARLQTSSTHYTDPCHSGNHVAGSDKVLLEFCKPISLYSQWEYWYDLVPNIFQGMERICLQRVE
mmetsp:Transcript_40331/g.70966  ORF Transcript_40331/g.70966 Transcript_40331/m.70966 type:complete len:98 (-) Transcript_40331:324-617(-)